MYAMITSYHTNMNDSVYYYRASQDKLTPVILTVGKTSYWEPHVLYTINDRKETHQLHFYTVTLYLTWLSALQMTQCNTYQFSSCFCSHKIFRNLCSHLQYWTKMVKYTHEHEFFYVIFIWKINHANHVKESFTISILVLEFQQH
jgi:hypothetical protein